MNTLYFDCFSGVSGDMVLGAFLDLGLDVKVLEEGLASLDVDGYHLHAEASSQYGIRGMHFHVHLTDEGHHHDHEHTHSHEHHHHEHTHDHHHDHEHGHAHSHAHTSVPDHVAAEQHHHHHRSYGDIRALIEASHLEAPVKATAQAIFRRVAEAEAKVHQSDLDAVHFHEVGAVDSIVDIVGTAIAYHAMGAPTVYVSPVNVGSGTVMCAHGRLPVPAPATAEILAHSHLASYAAHIDGEAATPTGVAILAELGTPVTAMPKMDVSQTAYGFGSRDFGMLNALRVFGGTMATGGDEGITVLETNIDDMTGEAAGYAMECLLEGGALDVFYTPIYMKKNRPAIRLTVIARTADVDHLAEIILKETTTIGMRKYSVDRICMDRHLEKRSTPLGEVTFKVCEYGDIHKVYPEYEEIKRIAKERGLSLDDVLAQI